MNRHLEPAGWTTLAEDEAPYVWEVKCDWCGCPLGERERSWQDGYVVCSGSCGEEGDD